MGQLSRRMLLLAAGSLLGGMGCVRDRARKGEESPATLLPTNPDTPVHGAIGSLDGLSPHARGPYLSDEGHALLSPPQPGEWLAEHSELGQTFPQYVRSRPNRPTGKRRVNYIVPIGEIEAQYALKFAALREFQERFFGAPVRLLGALEPGALRLTYRDHPHDGHRQLLTTSVLDALLPRLPPDAYCMIALTLTDLYPKPSWNYVFGQARLKQRVGVYSFARHYPSFYGEPEGEATKGLVWRRGLKLMAHETGHMYGIRHCVYYRCLMNGANSLSESDGTPLHLCPVCLRKLAWSSQIDVSERYQKLEQWYGEHRLTAQSEWIRRRQAAIARIGS